MPAIFHELLYTLWYFRDISNRLLSTLYSPWSIGSVPALRDCRKAQSGLLPISIYYFMLVSNLLEHFCSFGLITIIGLFYRGCTYRCYTHPFLLWALYIQKHYRNRLDQTNKLLTFQQLCMHTREKRWN